MIIRPTARQDLLQIDEIWKDYISDGKDVFGIPEPTNLVTEAVVEDNGKIIAFGMVKLFAEAILILDKNVSRRNKVNAIQALMLEAIRGSKQHNLSQLHSFIQDEQFAKFMMKNYSFKKAKGEALVMEL